MKVLKNKDGVRNTQRDNPSLMISLDGRPRELTGRVIGGTLAWAGNYRIALDNDNTHTTHLFAGINEEQSQYTLQPREVFTTPVFAFTFSDEGKSGVSSDRAAIDCFAQVLNGYGVTSTVRRKLGDDIDAACGQLRRSNMKEQLS